MTKISKISEDLKSEKPNESDEAKSDQYKEHKRWESEAIMILLFCVIVVIVAVDIIFLLNAKNWAGPLIIGIIQIIGLVVFFPPVMRVFQHITIAFGKGAKE